MAGKERDICPGCSKASPDYGDAMHSLSLLLQRGTRHEGSAAPAAADV